VVLAVWLAAGAVPSVTDDAASLHRLLAVSGDGLLVAELRGRVVGTLIAGWDGWRGNLYRLAVLPEHRRRGVARRLVAEGERRLAEKGARRASALVVGVEAPAMAFWHAAGVQLDARMERVVKPLGDRPGG
jgi:ribosomal protein S18 acetylase RimI-like enzyme